MTFLTLMMEIQILYQPLCVQHPQTPSCRMAFILCYLRHSESYVQLLLLLPNSSGLLCSQHRERSERGRDVLNGYLCGGKCFCPDDTQLWPWTIGRANMMLLGWMSSIQVVRARWGRQHTHLVTGQSACHWFPTAPMLLAGISPEQWKLVKLISCSCLLLCGAAPRTRQ